MTFIGNFILKIHTEIEGISHILKYRRKQWLFPGKSLRKVVDKDAYFDFLMLKTSLKTQTLLSCYAVIRKKATDKAFVFPFQTNYGLY